MIDVTSMASAKVELVIVCTVGMANIARLLGAPIAASAMGNASKLMLSGGAFVSQALVDKTAVKN